MCSTTRNENFTSEAVNVCLLRSVFRVESVRMKHMKLMQKRPLRCVRAYELTTRPSRFRLRRPAI
jgi:hypothetical protein